MRLLILLLVLWPGVAAAGAWPRAPGEVYVSTGQEFGEDAWSAIYAEVGGPWRLTFGLDAGGHLADGLTAYRTGLTLTPEVDGRAMVFVRVPVPEGLTAWFPAYVAAVELGVGADFAADPALDLTGRTRLGLSIGRPLSTGLGDGWANVDARAEIGGEAARFGLGAVVGLRPRERWTVEMGLFAEALGEATTVTLAPTIRYDVPLLGDVGVGVTLGLDGDARLRIAVSRTF